MRKTVMLMLVCIMLSGCSITSKFEKKQKVIQEQQNTKQSKVIATDMCSKMQKDALNEYLKKDYDILYGALKNNDKEVMLSCTAKDSDTVFDAVIFDHPELFWVSYQYSYRETKDGNIYLYPQYAYDVATIKELQKEVDSVVEPIIAKAEKMSSDYEKVKYIYDNIIEHTSYVNKEKNNQNMLSVFLDKEAVCAGYSKSMKYLLDGLGIENEIIIVQVIDDPDQYHVINLVKMDGEYYYIDPTFGDVKVERSFSNYRYAYFAMTSTEMLNIYKPLQSYKTTDAFKDTYFYKEQAYIDTYDEQQIIAIIRRNLQSDEPCLFIKCKTKEVYEQAKKTFASQHIFDLFHKAGYQPSKFEYYNLDANYCFFIKYV